MTEKRTYYFLFRLDGSAQKERAVDGARMFVTYYY